MEEFPLLQDIAIIFLLALGVSFLSIRLRVPTIVGFLLTGLLAGPEGLGFVSATEEVAALSQIGIILLLFTVGMEVSLKRLWEHKRSVILGGGLQVTLTAMAGFVIGLCFQRPFAESIFLGFLISLSSTAIVLRLLEQRRQALSPHGKVIVSTLVMQDIIVIPMVLLVPLLVGDTRGVEDGFLMPVATSVAIIASLFLLSQWLVPKILHQIAKTKSRELFLLAVLAICTTVAYTASIAGVSLSLGAFLAGLIVSESEYRNEAIGDIVPFQDIFTSFFFISMGMLLDIAFFIEHVSVVLLFTLGIIVLKGTIAAFATIILGFPIRTALLVGLSICQIGEFSFVLLKEGIAEGIGEEYYYQLFLSVSLLTMAITPTLILISEEIVGHISTLPFPKSWRFSPDLEEKGKASQAQDHIIIVGFGLTGRSIAHAAREARIPYIILDTTPEKVVEEKKKHEPIFFGDATHENVLIHAGIEKAVAIVVSINDPIASTRILRAAKKHNEKVYAIVRTPLLQEADLLYRAGADDVVPDELGASLEMFSRVMKKFSVEQEQVDLLAAEMRAEGYDLLRFLHKEPNLLTGIDQQNLSLMTKTFRVGRRSLVVDKTLEQLHFRRRFDATVLLIHRKKTIVYNPGPEEMLLAGDLVVVVGKESILEELSGQFISL